MREPEGDVDVQRPMRRLNPIVLLLLAGVVVLLLLIAYFASNRNPNQDKLTRTGATTTAQPASSEKKCASQATYELIKRDLFRRAAQLRGSDQSAYDKLAAYAVVRMENPVLESENRDTGAVNCSGSLSLDLPPGVAVVGGRRTLTSDIDYTVQPAADGSGTVLLLRNADAVVAPLATLARVGQTAPTTVSADTSAIAAQPEPTPTETPAAPPSEPARPTAARPSYNCANARTRGEIAVCADAGLATLDRNMAAQYGRAMANGSPEQQALLRRTRDRFLGYRDRCPDTRCIGDAYVGRMREIRDIMEGRWRPR